MKHKWSDNELAYPLIQRTHGGNSGRLLELVGPDSELKRSKNRALENILNILRWEDDGGPVLETGDPLPQWQNTKLPG